MRAASHDDTELRYEIRTTIRSQTELNPIESWLKLHAKGQWKMEFQGMSPPGEGAAHKLIVLFRFADQDDARRFQSERSLSSLSSESAVAAARASSARTEASSARSRHASSASQPQDFLARAGDLARGPAPVMASKVQLIGLDRLKAHFGDTWSRVAQRADQIADRAIRKCLTVRDMMTKVHDLNYLVLFAGLSEEEAQTRCRLIAADIARQLVGEDGTSDLLTVKTGVAPVQGDMLFKETPSLEELAQRLVATVEPVAAQTLPAPEQIDPLASVEFVYRPMWDVRHKVVTAYLCLPSVRLTGGRRVVGETAIVGIDTEDVQRALDMRVLKRAILDLQAAFNAGRKHLIAIPVHFYTVAHPQRRLDYLHECRHLPPMAAKLLLFEIVGAPEGVPQSRILEISTALRAYARAIIFRASVWSTHWGDLAQARIAAVGADLSHEHVSETILVERLIKFADIAEKRKLGCYLHGLRTLSLTVSAVGAGFHHLSGQPIEALSDAPPDAHRFSLADLYDALGPTG